MEINPIISCVALGPILPLCSPRLANRLLFRWLHKEIKFPQTIDRAAYIFPYETTSGMPLLGLVYSLVLWPLNGVLHNYFPEEVSN